MEIALYGANGFTSGLIGEACVRKGWKPILAGRDPEVIKSLVAAAGTWSHGLESRVSDLDRTDDWEPLLSGIDVLILGAGPYGRLPFAFMERLVRWPGHVIDLNGELAWTRKLGEAFQRFGAEARCRWIASCAFESGLALWLAREMESRWPEGFRPPRSMNSFYGHSNARLSPGTKATARLGREETQGIFLGSEWRLASQAELVYSQPLEPVFPGMQAVLSPLPEMFFWARDFQVEACGSYLVLPREETSLWLAARPQGPTAPPQPGPRPMRSESALLPVLEERMRHGFTVAVKATSKGGEEVWSMTSGHDPYGLTAWIVVRALVALAEKSLPAGLLPVSAVIPFQRALPMLREEFGMPVSGSSTT